MGVIVNGGKAACLASCNSLAVASNTPRTFNFTCPGGTDCLVVLVGALGFSNTITEGTLTKPISVLYANMPLQLVPDSYFRRDQSTSMYSTSMWYMRGPAPGTAVVSVTFSERTEGGQSEAVVPLRGVMGIGRARAAFANASEPLAIIGQTDGGTSSDLYLGGVYCSGTSITFTATGANQTNLAQTSGTSGGSMSIDSVPGDKVPSFSWTAAGGATYGHGIVVPFFGSLTTVGEALRRRPAKVRRRFGGLAMDNTPLEWW